MRQRERPLVVGHRGAAAVAPENTASSFRAAIGAGADAVETDVGLTRDGIAVLLHDETLERTTDGSGALGEWRWEALRRLDAGSWFAPAFRGERILSLEEAIAVVAARVPILLEMKAACPAASGTLPASGQRLLSEVLDVLSRNAARGAVMLSSFDWRLLEAAREIAAEVPRALTVGRLAPADPLSSARRIGAAALHLHEAICAPAFVAAAHAEELEVIAYTVNRRADLDRLLEAGVDGIFTDDPAAILEALGRHPEPGVP